jgi:plastocyanin
MKKHLTLIINSAFLALFVLIAQSCASPSEKNPEEVSSHNQEVHKYTVEIAQMKFSPSELRVEKGDSIVFANHDIVVHDVTDEKTKKWKSSFLQPGDSWTLVVEESSDYFCSIHVVMKGKIIVE